MNKQLATELVLYFAAMACITEGAREIYPPAGWLAMGGMLLFALWGGGKK